MKAPAQIDDLTLANEDLDTDSTYPPLGFLPVWDAELGNGDYYGLYWPYGYENREPIVCDMLHDECGMRLSFSSARIFVEWLERNDGVRNDESVDDPDFVGRRFQELKAVLQTSPAEAVSKLQGICEDFPESAEYWYTLAGQLRRIGDQQGAHSAAIRAFASNWAFGMPPQGTLKMLQNAKGKIDDPIVAHSDRLTLKFGGTKENSNYGLIKECIATYLSSSTPILGLLLNQNYGYMMAAETVSFQDRYAFDQTEWFDEHLQLCTKYLGDSRTQID